MVRIIPSIAWSIVAAVAFCAVGSMAAEPPRQGPQSNGTSPRYLRQEEAEIRPLESAPPREPARLPAAPLPRPAEQQAWGSSEMESEHPAARLPTENKPALPLSLPKPNSRGRSVTGDAPAVVTGAASLGIVLGLFLVVAWAIRRGMPRSAAPLPREVLEVLGRAPLGGKQQIHLLRCGPKLLLVCVSPAAVETLTEITDPHEVQRLTDLCQISAGPTNSFRKVLEQFSVAPAGARYFAHPQAAEPDFGSMAAELHPSHGGARLS